MAFVTRHRNRHRIARPTANPGSEASFRSGNRRRTRRRRGAHPERCGRSFRCRASSRQIRNMRAHARYPEAFGGPGALVDIVAAAPIGIGHDGLTPYFMKRDIRRRVARRRGDGEPRRPDQDSSRPIAGPACHPWSRRARRTGSRCRATRSRCLRAHHFADRQHRETEIVGPPGRGSIVAGPVVPEQPPITLAQTTNSRSVSTGFPGLTIVAHQPGLPVTGLTSPRARSPSAHDRSAPRWILPR